MKTVEDSPSSLLPSPTVLGMVGEKRKLVTSHTKEFFHETLQSGDAVDNMSNFTSPSNSNGSQYSDSRCFGVKTLETMAGDSLLCNSESNDKITSSEAERFVGCEVFPAFCGKELKSVEERGMVTRWRFCPRTGCRFWVEYRDGQHQVRSQPC